MRKWLVASSALAAGGVLLFGKTTVKSTATLKRVFFDDDFQLTGVTVSKRGRLFVCYPRWSDRYVNAVVEVLPDGSSKPFPDDEWNGWDRKPSTAGSHFVCVQSIFVDDTDTLWILDAAAPLQTTPVPGGAKLIAFDFASNQIEKIIRFGPEVIRPDSYLNDVRIDRRGRTAYITDSGAGGIVVVDLASGQAWRVLDGHPSVKAEAGLQIVINGKALRDAQGRPPVFHSDGIALSADGEFLYYQPISATSLYRVRTAVIRDRQSTTRAIRSAVEFYAATFPVDGLWIDDTDRIYLADITHNAVARITPNKRIERIVVDPRLQWPDTFAQGPDGSMYITASHINESAPYNQGRSVRRRPFGVYCFKP